jgi:hypothetical protein
MFFFSRFEYHMFYVLYPFVTYLLTLPRTRLCNSIDSSVYSLLPRIRMSHVSSEVLVSTYKATRSHNPDYHDMNTRSLENYKICAKLNFILSYASVFSGVNFFTQSDPNITAALSEGTLPWTWALPEFFSWKILGKEKSWCLSEHTTPLLREL